MSARRADHSDLSGERFGWLLVLRRGEPKRFKSSRGNTSTWVCLCDCGNEVTYYQCGLVTGGSTSCGCRRRLSLAGMMSKHRGLLSGTYWCSVRKNAKLRQIELAITQEDAWLLYVKQKGLCAITGTQLIMDPAHGTNVDKRVTIQTASLDRIDSNKGYVAGNVRWVHYRVNLMRLDMSDSEFIEWCDLVSSFAKKLAA